MDDDLAETCSAAESRASQVRCQAIRSASRGVLEARQALEVIHARGSTVLAEHAGSGSSADAGLRRLVA